MAASTTYYLHDGLANTAALANSGGPNPLSCSTTGTFAATSQTYSVVAPPLLRPLPQAVPHIEGSPGP